MNHGSFAKLVKRLRTIILPIDFEGFLRFRGSMLRRQIDLGGSWMPLGCLLDVSWGVFDGVLEASWGILEPFWKRLEMA